MPQILSFLVGIYTKFLFLYPAVPFEMSLDVIPEYVSRDHACFITVSIFSLSSASLISCDGNKLSPLHNLYFFNAMEGGQEERNMQSKEHLDT